jgi:hypothetical protein
MRRFLLGWKAKGYEASLQAYIVNYADDFVICTRDHACEALEAMRDLMQRLKLTVNEKKTRCCQLPGETFTFLGYTFGQCYSRRTGRDYLSPYPSDKKVQSLCREVSALTARRTVGRGTQEVVAKLNEKLRGWADYFSLGPVVHVYEVVTKHVRRRLRRWLCKKHKVKGRGYGRYPNEYLHDRLGLLDLTERPRHRPLWAKA